MGKDKFKTDVTSLLERITNNLIEFDNEENAPHAKIECCNDIIKTSSDIGSLATKQLNLEFKKRTTKK